MTKTQLDTMNLLASGAKTIQEVADHFGVKWASAHSRLIRLEVRGYVSPTASGKKYKLVR